MPWPPHTGIAAPFPLTSSPSEGALLSRDIIPPSEGELHHRLNNGKQRGAPFLQQAEILTHSSATRAFRPCPYLPKAHATPASN